MILLDKVHFNKMGEKEYVMSIIVWDIVILNDSKFFTKI